MTAAMALLPERTRSEVLGVKTSTYLFEGDVIQSVTPDHTSKRTKGPSKKFPEPSCCKEGNNSSCVPSFTMTTTYQKAPFVNID